METQLLRDGDEARFVLVDLDPALHASAAELLARCTEGFERRTPWRGDVEAIFERFEASIETMLRQHGGLEPVPWQQALRRLVLLLNGEADWCLVGSCALAVRGIAAAPRDIDAVVREADFASVAQRLDDHLIEPVSSSDDWIARWFCRAFLSGRVECIAGIPDWVDSPEPSDFGPLAWSRRERVHWCGVEVSVPPLDLQLAVTRRRGLLERARMIEEAMSAG